MNHITKMQFNTLIRETDYIVRDHRVHQVRIMPGVTFIDMIYRLLRSKGFQLSEITLRNILFIEPIATSPSFDQRIQITFQKEGDHWLITGKSQKIKDKVIMNPEWNQNLQCELHLSGPPAGLKPRIDPQYLKKNASRVEDLDYVYSFARNVEIHHFEFMKGLGKLYLGNGYQLAEIHLSDLAAQYLDYFYLHPAYLDSSTLLPIRVGLEYSAKLSREDSGEKPFIPMYIDTFRAFDQLTEKCLVYVEERGISISASNDVIYSDIEICHENGEIIAEFRKIAFKKIRNHDLIHQLERDQRLENQPPATQNKSSRPFPETKNRDLDPGKGFNPAESPGAEPLKKLVEQDLQKTIGALLNKPAADLNLQKGFYDHGLDSSNLLQIVRNLEDKIGQQLYPTLLFEYTNIKELAEFLAEKYGAGYVSHLSQLAAPEPEPISNSPVTTTYWLPLWEPVEIDPAGPKAELGDLLLFDEDQELRDQLSALLANRGLNRRIILVKPGQNFGPRGELIFELDPANRDHYQRLIESLDFLGLAPTQVLHAWSKGSFAGNGTALRAQLQLGLYSVFHFCQQWMRRKPRAEIRFLYLYPAPQGEIQPQYAAVNGLARTIQLENPKFLFKTIEFCGSDETPSLARMGERILREIETPAAMPLEVRYEGARRLVKRYQEIDIAAVAGVKLPLKQAGIYLITGGTGGLGLIFARYLAQSVRAKLILIGRSELDGPKAAQIKEIESLGSEVLYFQVDITKRPELENLARQIKSRFHPINGIIHSAGIIHDALLIQKRFRDMEAVLAPKIEGTIALDEIFRDEALDFFVMFSSSTAVTGNIGQGDYAYSNSFMDHFAQYREELRRRGQRSGKTLAINWPLWEDGGMKVDPQSRESLKTTFGMVPLAAGEGIAAFENALKLATPQLLIIRGVAAKISQALTLPPILGGFGEQLENRTLEPASWPVREQLAPPLSGGDLQAIQLSPTPKTEIAIIGLAGRYPMAGDLEEFWENLKSGKDCVTEIPPDRWDYRRYFDPDKNRPGKSYSKWGGFMDQIDQFDPLLFNISPREAELMDPQERVFLETVWRAIEDAGYTKAGLEKYTTGVFAGVMWGQYQLFAAETDGQEIALSSIYASIANRVSYFYNFRGPSIALDTMCSSSLTAIHLACESIRRGECEVAIAGGVNVALHPRKYLYLSQQKFLSTDGRCRSFGEGGDGYVPGEGVGAIILKPLEKALVDGDHIYAVVKGSSINHGGNTSGYTVPNPNVQAALIIDALEKTQVDPRTISYIEAHGTGTSLGDPIEMNGLIKAFQKYTGDQQFCSIGSLKSNIGHLESAAGIAAVTKVLLQMKHRQLVPSVLHSGQLNPNIRFSDSPFYLQRELAPWAPVVLQENGLAREYPRRSGISAFGAGGANAHLILEEFQSHGPLFTPSGKALRLFVLSAKNTNRLKAYAQKMLEFFERELESNSNLPGNEARWLLNLVYTLQVGREPMDERMAIVASSVSELRQKLAGFVAEQNPIPGVYWGNCKHPQVGTGFTDNYMDGHNVVKACLENGQWDRIAQLWIGGGEIGWNILYSGETPGRMSLPDYPFERKRYWFNSYQTGSPRNTSVESRKGDLPVHPRDIHPEVGTIYGAKWSNLVKPAYKDEVALRIVDENVALVIMQDRKNRNMFSEPLVAALMDTFQQIHQNKAIKVAILTGYDNIFSMGGTQEQLLNIAAKTGSFTDFPFLYRGLLEAEIPVISAIQGHASGGGLLLGLYGDIIIMSEESIYTAVFTKYGFTPGMGATFILKEKLGGNLATEMMFTAKSFQGDELKNRGSSVIFRKRADVLNEALLIAKMLADKPAQTLKILKKELSGRILAQLVAVLERETQMHDQTFSNPEVKQRIQYYFLDSKNEGRPSSQEAASGQMNPASSKGAIKLRPTGPAPATAAEVAAVKEINFDEGFDERFFESLLNDLEAGRVTPAQVLQRQEHFKK